MPCRKFCFAIILTLAAVSARADLPLTVEGLITDQDRFRLDVSLAYANAERQDVVLAEPIVIQTGPASFIAWPSRISQGTGNSDTLVATLGLRYGLRAQTEVYARASSLWSRQRHSNTADAASQRNFGFADAWVGIKHQFKPEDDTAAVLAFAEFALREQHRQSSSSFKSAVLGATAYQTLDPVALSITAAYRFSQSRKDGQQNYQPGRVLLINPMLAFAINDRVTLNSGLQWTHRQTDRYDGQPQGINRNATDLLLGVGYGLANSAIFNFTLKANISGRSGAELQVS